MLVVVGGDNHLYFVMHCLVGAFCMRREAKSTAPLPSQCCGSTLIDKATY